MLIEVHVMSGGLCVTPALIIASLERAQDDIKKQYDNLEFEDIGNKTILVDSAYQMSRVQTIIKP